VPTTVLHVGGMNCDHCVKSVTSTLRHLSGVARAEVSLDGHRAVVEHAEKSPTLGEMIRALEESGFEAEGA
jgi:copper chaperone